MVSMRVKENEKDKETETQIWDELRNNFQSLNQWYQFNFKDDAGARFKGRVLNACSYLKNCSLRKKEKKKKRMTLMMFKANFDDNTL